MNGKWIPILLGVAMVYFGVEALQVAPAFVRLLAALATRTVKWPGPRIHDPARGASIVRERLGVHYENLFPTFISSTLAVLGAFGVSVFTLIGSTPSMTGHIRINWTLTTVILILVALAGGEVGFRQAQRILVHVNSVLSGVVREVEPRSADGHSARSEYAIEHPLIGVRNLPSNRKRALDQFYESVRCHQDGNEYRALSLYNEATRADPCLHENAREALSRLARDSSSTDAGPICYWLGIHCEWLSDLRQAAVSYEKAVNAFDRIGYRKRASRACNNLGSVKMQLHDPTAMEEFERAIALDPKNGMAYISVGVTYYRISQRGDPRFEQALDAFADAIAVDPATYGPLVISRLRSIGYTWKEDWEDIARRVVSRRPGVTVERSSATKTPEGVNGSGKKRMGFATNQQLEGLGTRKSGQDRRIGFGTTVSLEKPLKTYRNEKHGFEIDIPQEWRPSPIPIPGGKARDLLQYGCPEEAFNFETGPLFPEPPIDQTERDFVQFAMFRGFSALKLSRITVGGKEHVCASYHVSDVMGERWNKKYMIVFGATEYAITATCNDEKWFLQREEHWDAIVRSFRLLDGST
jgi:tetratricopeptide (TPR) repeat protein